MKVKDKVREGYKQTELGEIPVEWEVKKIKDVAEIISGGTPNKQIKEYWQNGNIFWATPTDITSNKKYIYYTEEKITEKGLRNSSAKILPVGSILLTSRATIGEKCINKKPMATNQGFKSLVCRDDIVFNEYLYYYIDIIKGDLIKLARGSTFLEIPKAAIANMKIVVPPFSEQKKIAEILSTVDEQIEHTEQLIEKTNELKKGLMQKLLTKGIGHIRFKKTAGGEIPESWELRNFGEILKLEYGFNLPEKNRIPGQYPVVGSQGIVGYHNEKFVQGPGIVIGRKGSIDKVNYIEDDFCPIDTTYFVNNINNYDWKWLYYLISSKDLMSLNAATGVPSLNRNDFYTLKGAVPPIEEQKKIAMILTTIENIILGYESRKQQLQQLKKGLMQKLLTGKIRVKV